MVKSRTKHKSQREQEQAALAKQLRPVAKFLLGITNDLDWGEKLPVREYDGTLSKHLSCPLHVNTKEMLLRFLQGDCYLLYPKRLSQKALIQHFQGKRTLYFTGSRGKHTLVYIDPDCHKSGTKEGAFQFLEYLKSKYFPNLYYEASTHGNGGSGYIIVDTSICSDRDFNALLKRLDKFLKHVLATTTFDVEDVEAKGAIPEIVWNPKFRGVIDSMKCGGLAKFPREMLTRSEEFMNTTRLTTDELQAIVESPLPELPPPAEEEVKSAPKGSVLGKRIDPELLRTYLPLAKDIMQNKTHRVGNRVAATAEDMAAVVTMLEYFTKHPNEDGSMPYLRFKVMWDEMYKCGDLTRVWDNKRFAYLRNMLSDVGFIAWQDHTFIPPSGKGKVKVKGKAMCWRASELLMAALAECRENSTLLNNTAENDAQNEQEVILSINKPFLTLILNGSLLSYLKKQMEGKPIIRPKMVFRKPDHWYNDIENIEKAMKWRKKAA